jgi:hypothetical protein
MGLAWVFHDLAFHTFMGGKWCQEQFSLSLVAAFGGKTLKNFQACFPGTMRVEKQLLYWNKEQSDRSTEAHQTTR